MSPSIIQKNGEFYQTCEWSGRLITSGYGIPRPNSGREYRFADAACAVAWLMEKYKTSNNPDVFTEIITRISADLKLGEGQPITPAPPLKADSSDYSYRKDMPWMHRPSIYISAREDWEEHLKSLENKKKMKGLTTETTFVYAFSTDKEKLPTFYELEREKSAEGLIFSLQGQSQMRMFLLPVKKNTKAKHIVNYKYLPALSFGNVPNENIQLKSIVNNPNINYKGTIYVISNNMINDIEATPIGKKLIEKTQAAQANQESKKQNRKKRSQLVLHPDVENFIQSKKLKAALDKELE